MVDLRAPRISQFHESHAVRELFDSDNEIGVIADETIVVSLGVTFTGSCSHHDVVLSVIFHHLCPKGVRSDVRFIVPPSLIGATTERAHGVGRPASHDVLVVAVILCEGLLKNGAPEGIVMANVAVGCPVGAVSVLFQRQEVIDHDSVRDTERVEVDGIDALIIQCVLSVQEDFLHAAWHFGQARGCGEEPTVADSALSDIVIGDSVTEEGLVWENFFCSPPGRWVIKEARRFTELFPNQRGVVGSEVIVTVS